MAPNEWDDFAAGWDSNEDVRIYAENAFDSWTQKVAPLAPDLSNCRVMDFGCGTGMLTEKLAPLCNHVVAVDTSANMINVLLRKANDSSIDNVTALQIAVNATTIDECEELASMFDLIVASSVCSFLPNYEETLGDLTSVLNPGGYFVQWDWLADMPADRIQSAFKGSGLLTHGIEEAFSMNTEKNSMAVVMGIGRLPL
jgi:2-polyprenyl-3-methyl-5-hydroxy-6-metoxy-1,4-benzoquinol methylase